MRFSSLEYWTSLSLDGNQHLACCQQSEAWLAGEGQERNSLLPRRKCQRLVDRRHLDRGENCPAQELFSRVRAEEELLRQRL